MAMGFMEFQIGATAALMVAQFVAIVRNRANHRD
jgi:hypothetical protein